MSKERTILKSGLHCFFYRAGMPLFTLSYWLPNYGPWPRNISISWNLSRTEILLQSAATRVTIKMLRWSWYMYQILKSSAQLQKAMPPVPELIPALQLRMFIYMPQAKVWEPLFAAILMKKSWQKCWSLKTAKKFFIYNRSVIRLNEKILAAVTILRLIL